MKKLAIFYCSIFMSITFYSFACFAEAKKENQNKEEDHSYSHYNTIIEEYKDFLASVSPSVRKEIVNFRFENAKLVKQKRDLYQRLTVQAQRFLKQEEAYRKKLPLDLYKKFDKAREVKIKQSN